MPTDDLPKDVVNDKIIAVMYAPEEQDLSENTNTRRRFFI